MCLVSTLSQNCQPIGWQCGDWSKFFIVYCLPLQIICLVLVVDHDCYSCLLYQKLEWPKCIPDETDDEARKMTDLLNKPKVSWCCNSSSFSHKVNHRCWLSDWFNGYSNLQVLKSSSAITFLFPEVRLFTDNYQSYF